MWPALGDLNRSVPGCTCTDDFVDPEDTEWWEELAEWWELQQFDDDDGVFDDR